MRHRLHPPFIGSSSPSKMSFFEWNKNTSRSKPYETLGPARWCLAEKVDFTAILGLLCILKIIDKYRV